MNRSSLLTAPQTCKALNQASGERQTWFNQVARLRIPIPTGIVLSTAELKNWVISVRLDERWVNPQDDDKGKRSLSLHWFDMRQQDLHVGEVPTKFVMANLMPGGKFVVMLYTDGQVDLKEIKIESEDKRNLQDRVQYKRGDPEGFRIKSWSQLLTETKLGHPLVAYVDRERHSLGIVNPMLIKAGLAS